MQEDKEVDQGIFSISDFEKCNLLEFLRKKDIVSLFNLLLDKRLSKLEICLDNKIIQEFQSAIANIEITFNLKDIDAFNSESKVSSFAQKLVARTLTKGFLATHRTADGEEKFQIFINNLNPLKDSKRALLHELTHVVDELIKLKFPELSDDEEASNDIKFFLWRGLVGMSAIILANWAIYSIDVLPLHIKAISAIAVSALGAYKLENMQSYKNRPDELRARENEKLISNRLFRAIRKVMSGGSR